MSWEEEVEKALEVLKSKREKFNYAFLGLTAGTLIFQVNVQNLLQAHFEDQKVAFFISIILYFFSLFTGIYRVLYYLVFEEMHIFFLLENDTVKIIKDKDLIEEIKYKKYKNVIELIARDKYILIYQLATYLFGILAFMKFLLSPSLSKINSLNDLIKSDDFVGIVFIIIFIIILYLMLYIVLRKVVLYEWLCFNSATYPLRVFTNSSSKWVANPPFGIV